MMSTSVLPLRQSYNTTSGIYPFSDIDHSLGVPMTWGESETPIGRDRRPLVDTQVYTTFLRDADTLILNDVSSLVEGDDMEFIEDYYVKLKPKAKYKLNVKVGRVSKFRPKAYFD